MEQLTDPNSVVSAFLFNSELNGSRLLLPAWLESDCDPCNEETRGYMALDWAVRTALPILLGRPHGQRFADLPPIIDQATADAVRSPWWETVAALWHTDPVLIPAWMIAVLFALPRGARLRGHYAAACVTPALWPSASDLLDRMAAL